MYFSESGCDVVQNLHYTTTITGQRASENRKKLNDPDQIAAEPYDFVKLSVQLCACETLIKQRQKRKSFPLLASGLG
ncbi:hypothetical protein T11_3265 [Trichinella zimbabwensis]|uniref:Uncharacterized protein n=1 Tax=Trichinella zimbabwensis TaxID=268475 RepID=A0A0V1HGX4_9BILA|nr:hypothetical protein T11_3265 [Trichinella zimbabwensis]